MKNVQVIDGADNCAYSIFSVGDRVFKKIFHQPGQDVAFTEDVINKYGARMGGKLLACAWRYREDKTTIVGLHGLLYVGLGSRRKYYPNRREDDFVRQCFVNPRNPKRRRAAGSAARRGSDAKKE